MQAHEEEGKEEQNGVMKKKKESKNIGNLVQIGLRMAAIVASIAAASLMFTSHQNSLVYGVPMEAKYSYSSAFKFFAFVNAIASALALLSLGLTLILWKHGRIEAANHHFFFFLHDLGVMSLLLAGSSAATAIGYVGKYGNDHAGWLPICDQFSGFCHRVVAAITLGFSSAFFFLLLTVFSAAKYSSTTRLASVQVQNTASK